ncbi:YagK/YfjJ domain-containing protein [Acinetobacter nosocomialis]|uniref:YagK/YfjJ domain-containing protein n=1 Tax=Acinetobacter nosocomialis TaxID=106654 RepID=UPI001B82ADED|nr:inovirus-type Gp2 protein [Acinetobacter nosocomialis]MBR7686709.1 inovirus-type Gp2 protein [Acinetobacter nosocomialis]MBR7700655.1 inovirus-type Gp2 protein [Acinetobacter nosocomialis]MBR7759503.1 inovirus-type Gp2 protein [Acinetobacter nosocomialis]
MSPNIPLANESSILISIEDFMISTCHEQFIDDHDEFKRELLEAVVLFKQIYRFDLSYSKIIQVFTRVIILVDYIMEKLDFQIYEDILRFELNHIFHIQGMIQFEMKSSFLDIHKFKYQERKNQIELERYLNKILNHYARLVFVRVDVGIFQEHQANWDVENFHRALEILRNRMSNKDSCFRHLQGCVWAFEQGAKKGYHCHLLLIYDGNMRDGDEWLGEEVGKYWQQYITNNQGCYFNCNRKENKEKFEVNGLLGIGMIHRNQQKQVENAIRAGLYLVNPKKVEQRLRAKTSPKMRSFGISQFDLDWRRGI